MDTDGLIVEDGYVIVGRAGQRVARPDGLTHGQSTPRTGTVTLVGRSEPDTGSGVRLAEVFVDLTGVPGLLGEWPMSVGLTGAGATRPGI
jgi:hypothetical protein